MAVSVAPLTTTVMNAVDQREAGAASGINNAVSRIAALLAVAVLGMVLSTVFNSALGRQLDTLGVPPPVRTEIEAQRSKLADTDTADPRGQQAVKAAFVAGFRSMAFVATALAIASSSGAAALITSKRLAG
jgi:hypothetical protein